VALGQALQLTNILRDVPNDAARGRIYLPQEALRAHGVTEQEILRGEFSAGYPRLAASVAERARAFYRTARETLPPEDRHRMVAAELMGAVYWRLLRKLESKRYNVFGPDRVRLSRLCKLALVLLAWARHLCRCPQSDYGA
jgi:phytoene synthase